MYEKRDRLISRLIQKSRDGELEWEEGLEPDSVQVSFTTSSVTLIKGKAWNDVTNYTFVIRNSDGDIVDRFGSQQLNAVQPGDVSTLFERAWREVMQADQTIDDILGELE